MEKKVVEVFLSAHHMKEFFKEGNKVIIKSLNDGNEFLFSGHVTKKVLSIRKQAVIIKMDEIKKFFNLRNNERFHVRYPATIKASGKTPEPAVLLDISLGGTLITSNASFNEKESVHIEILYTNNKVLNFLGRILRKQQLKDGFKYGIGVQSIDNENSLVLNELIEYLTYQKKQIARELKIFKRVKYTVYVISIIVIFFTVFVMMAAEGI
ncbi:MAG: PilZ domain-containing protein [Clostridia bacterium]|nr:PilZ domain-containing protein [Clostridia bacterium]